MAIVGIDLGTTNSLVSTWKDGKCILIPNQYNEYLTPSVVYFEKDGVEVGKLAKLKMVSEPNKTLASFKRDMGTSRKYDIFNKEYTPSEVSSFVIRQLIKDAENYLGEKVEEAIISVPAYFNDKQRNATRLAGELAGVTVNRIINEPSAAALATRIDGIEQEDKSYLVFDFGGGTLDISVVDVFDNVIEIISVSGDNHLGGDDFDRALTKHFCSKHSFDYASLSSHVRASIMSQIKQMKHELSNQQEVDKDIIIEDNKYAFHLDNQVIVSVCADLFQRIHTPVIQALSDAQMDMEEIDEIVMVGGSSKMSAVQKFVEFVCKKKPYIEKECDYTVAGGCGITTGIIARNVDIKDVVLTDICPFTLGVSSFYNNDLSELLMSPIIERNTVLPVSRTNTYNTIYDNQKTVEFSVLQGEQRLAKNNLELGTFKIAVPPQKAGKEVIEVRFTYDINGILAIEAKVKSTGESFKTLIIDKENTLSEEELKEKVKALEIIKEKAHDQGQYDLLLARGEKLYTQTSGYQREMIMSSIRDFKCILASNRLGKIKKAHARISRMYDAIERDINLFTTKEEIEEYLEDFNDFLQQDDDDDLGEVN